MNTSSVTFGKGRLRSSRDAADAPVVAAEHDEERRLRDPRHVGDQGADGRLLGLVADEDDAHLLQIGLRRRRQRGGQRDLKVLVGHRIGRVAAVSAMGSSWPRTPSAGRSRPPAGNRSVRDTSGRSRPCRLKRGPRSSSARSARSRSGRPGRARWAPAPCPCESTSMSATSPYFCASAGSSTSKNSQLRIAIITWRLATLLSELPPWWISKFMWKASARCAVLTSAEMPPLTATSPRR